MRARHVLALAVTLGPMPPVPTALERPHPIALLHSTRTQTARKKGHR